MRAVRRVAVAVLAAVLVASGSSAGAAPDELYGPRPVLLADLSPGPGPSEAYDGTPFGRRLFFTGVDRLGAEPFITDGTGGGTRRLADITPGAQGSGPRLATVAGPYLYFVATAPATGAELWRTDGTPEGTRMVVDLVSGPGSPGIGELVAFGGLVYFAADTPLNGRELWVTGGTAASTTIAVDVWPGPGSSNPSGLVALGGRLLLSAQPGPDEPVLLGTDGTPGGTAVIGGTGSISPTSPSRVTVSAGRGYFAAAGTGTGREPWVTTGSTAAPLGDLCPGACSSSPTRFVGVGAKVAFTAYAPVPGHELWTSDGTTGGTRVHDLAPGSGSSRPDALIEAGGRIQFTAGDLDHGREPWVLPRSGAPRLLRDIVPGPRSSTVWTEGSSGGLVLLSVVTEASGEEPWTSDGTTAGTRQLADLVPGIGDSAPVGVGAVGGTWIFSARHPYLNREIWAWTSRPSTTALRAQVGRISRKAARKGRPRPVTVTLRVAASGVVPPGRVQLLRAGRVVGTAVLSRGTARLKLRLRPGRHVLRARYLGSLDAQRSQSAPVVVKIRRRGR